MLHQGNLSIQEARACWAEGVHNAETWDILPSMQTLRAFIREEINQLDKDISEFGKDGAGSVLTQIARYSPILNQSTGLSNKGFMWAFTGRSPSYSRHMDPYTGLAYSLAPLPNGIVTPAAGP